MCLSTACSGGGKGQGFRFAIWRNKHYDDVHDGMSPSELPQAPKALVSTCPTQTKPPLHENRPSPVEYDAGSQMQQQGRARSRTPLSVTPPRSTTKSPPASRPSSSSGSAKTPQSAPVSFNARPGRALTPFFDNDPLIDRDSKKDLISEKTRLRLDAEREKIGHQQRKRKLQDSHHERA